MKWVSVGMTTLDTLLFVPSIATSGDGVTRIGGHVRCLGGKGFIAACGLACLSCDVKLLSLIGSSPSDRKEFIEHGGFRKTPIFVELPLLERNNRAWITISKRHKVFTYVDRAPLRPRSTEKMVEIVGGAIAGADGVLVSAEHLYLVLTVADFLRKSNLHVALNLSMPLLTEAGLSDERIAELVDLADTLIVNALENKVALARLGIRNWGDARWKRLREVVITEGKKGGKYSVRPFSSFRNYAAPIVSAVCPVGAGDTFFAGYVAGRFEQKMSVRESCTFAAELAARKVQLLRSHM